MSTSQCEQQHVNLPKNILVVDDEETIRLFLKEALTQYGHKVIIAASQYEACSKIKSTRFDLAFVDILFPNSNYNGFDIINVIKKKQPDCLIVILTANPSVDTAIKAVRHNLFDYLEKPIAIKVLASITHKAFQNMDYYNGTNNHLTENCTLISKDLNLTFREIEILILFAKGFSYTETSQHLNCKLSTIQWHIKNIYRKLGVHSKSEAIHEAVCMKIIDINNA